MKVLPLQNKKQMDIILKQNTIESEFMMPATFLKISRSFFYQGQDERDFVADRNIPYFVSKEKRSAAQQSLACLMDDLRRLACDRISGEIYIHLTQKTVRLKVKAVSGQRAQNFKEARKAWRAVGPIGDPELGEQMHKLLYETKEVPSEWNPIRNTVMISLKLWGSVDDPQLDLHTSGPKLGLPLSCPISGIASTKFRERYRTSTLRDSTNGHGWTLRISEKGGRGANGDLTGNRPKKYESKYVKCVDRAKSDMFYKRHYGETWESSEVPAAAVAAKTTTTTAKRKPIPADAKTSGQKRETSTQVSFEAIANLLSCMK